MAHESRAYLIYLLICYIGSINVPQRTGVTLRGGKMVDPRMLVAVMCLQYGIFALHNSYEICAISIHGLYSTSH